MSRKKSFIVSNTKHHQTNSFHTGSSNGPTLGQGPLRLVNHNPSNGVQTHSPYRSTPHPDITNYFSTDDPSQSPAYTTNQFINSRTRVNPHQIPFHPDNFDAEKFKRQISEQIQKQMETALSTVTDKLDDLIHDVVQQHAPTHHPDVPKYNSVQPSPQPPQYRPSVYQSAPTPSIAPYHHPLSSPPLVQRTTPTPSLTTPTHDPINNLPPISHSPTSAPSESEDRYSSKLTFLEKELNAAFTREQKLEKELQAIKDQLGKEKVGVDQQLQELKKEVESAPTPQNNKFTSLSQELGDIVKAMNNLVDDQNSSDASIPSSESTPSDGKAKDTPASTSTEPDSTKDKKTQPPKEKDTKANKEAAPSNKKKKIMIIVATTIFILGGIGFAAFKFMGGSSSVDPALMQEYLPAEAIPQEQSQASEPTDTSAATPSPEVQGASTTLTDRRAAAQSEISYGETRWETHKDPKFGLQFDYPINVADTVRTDMSITVLRKTGYIFKVQKIETALELDDYWKQIKARSLRYKVQSLTFRDYPALYLELEDITEYPGDRYLVKRDDMIYDIWYATASKSLNDDDAKRVDVMLNSFKFIDISA